MIAATSTGYASTMLRTLYLAVLALAACALAGCASRCKQVDAVRAELLARGAAPREIDVRVLVPLERANELIAELLRERPLSVPMEPPSLGGLVLPVRALTSVAREVRVLPGPPGKVRFEVTVEVRAGEERLLSIAALAEVVPLLQRRGDATELVLQFGVDDLLELQPRVSAPAPEALARAVARWIPSPLRERIPRATVEDAAKRLGAHLLSSAYQTVRRAVPQLGDLTRLKLQLPELPVTTASVRTVPEAPLAGEAAGAGAAQRASGALVVELITELPVRRGLPALTDAATPPEVTFEFSGSAASELANWAIERGHLPRWYTRDLTPRESGEFRPWLDFLDAEPGHPFKIHVLQERGGCSYFRVGASVALALEGEQLEVTLLDRVLERAIAPPWLALAARLKYFLTGSIDQSRRVAARTTLSIGGRPLETRVVGAELAAGLLRFAVQLSSAEPAAMAALPR